MKKRIREKKIKQYNLQNLRYLEYLYREEKEYNWELTELLEQTLSYLPDEKLKKDIKRVIDAASV